MISIDQVVIILSAVLIILLCLPHSYHELTLLPSIPLLISLLSFFLFYCICSFVCSHRPGKYSLLLLGILSKRMLFLSTCGSVNTLQINPLQKQKLIIALPIKITAILLLERTYSQKPWLYGTVPLSHVCPSIPFQSIRDQIRSLLVFYIDSNHLELLQL